MNAPATRLFSDVSFSDVFFSVSFETRLPPLASENKLPKVETFLQRKFFPSQKCQTQSLNVIMTIWPPRVGEAISRKILKLRPWVKNLRSKQGNFERQRHPPFASEQPRPTAAPEVHKQARKLQMKGLGWRVFISLYSSSKTTHLRTQIDLK